jgi:hypothetical protein
MGDMSFPVGTDNVSIPENLHGLGHGAGNDQITPRGPGIQALFVNPEADKIAV